MDDPRHADDLLAYVTASPTPFHAVRESVARLEAAGYRALDERDAWALHAGDRVYVVRGGASLAALEIGTAPVAERGFRLVGAHTDSPNLRLKPRPELARAGVQ